MKFTTAFLFLSLLILCQCKDDSQKIHATLSETGAVNIYPNKGVVELNATCLNMNLEISKKCVADADNLLRSQFNNIGISSQDIHSGSITRQREYAWENDANQFKGYRTTKTMSIEVAGIENLEKAIDLALGLKEVSITSTYYSHTQYDSLKTEAYLVALSKLKKRTESIRKNLGSKGCEIIEISDSPLEFSGSLMNPSYSNNMENMVNSRNANNELNAQPGKMVIEAKASMTIQCAK